MQQVLGNEGSAQAAAIRFRLSRVAPDIQVSGHEDISISSLLAAASAHRARSLGAPASHLRIAA